MFEDRKNFYEILGVPKTATPTEIKQAYRQLSFKFHPDRNKDPHAQSIFQSIGEAYETLSDPSKRRHYDKELVFGEGMMGNGGIFMGGDEININEMLNMMFHGATMGGGPIGRMPGIHVFEMNSTASYLTPLVKPIALTLEQCYSGCTIPVELERTITHHELEIPRIEKETIYIDVPPGIDNNESIIIEHKGNIVCGKRGELKIVVQILPHAYFHRSGLDIMFKTNISLKEALLGTTISFQHLNGKLYNITSTPEIIYPGMKKQISGLGMKRPGSNNVGNLWFEFCIVFPHSLTDSQREALQQCL